MDKVRIFSLKNESLESNNPYSVKVCRPSPLGNPYHIGKDGDRNTVCDKYAEWLKLKLQEKTVRSA